MPTPWDQAEWRREGEGVLCWGDHANALHWIAVRVIWDEANGCQEPDLNDDNGKPHGEQLGEIWYNELGDFVSQSEPFQTHQLDGHPGDWVIFATPYEGGLP